MNEDIKARLREPRPMSMFLSRTDQAQEWARQMKEAANHIEALETEIAKLRRELEARPVIRCGCCGNCPNTGEDDV